MGALTNGSLNVSFRVFEVTQSTKPDSPANAVTANNVFSIPDLFFSDAFRYYFLIL